MKEIKFRGQRLDNGQWVFGDLVHDCEGNPCINPVIDGLYSDDFVHIHPDTIGQLVCTDYDGKEVYEGDIVNACSMIGYVEYHRGEHAVNENGSYRSFQTWHPHIIGNIYETPELLIDTDIVPKDGKPRMVMTRRLHHRVGGFDKTPTPLPERLSEYFKESIESEKQFIASAIKLAFKRYDVKPVEGSTIDYHTYIWLGHVYVRGYQKIDITAEAWAKKVGKLKRMGMEK